MRYKIIDDMDISGEALSRLIDRLPAWRRAEALKFKFETGRKESALAYLLLSEMLGYQPRFAISEHGKPYIPDSLVSFNISHCKSAVACVVSETRSVGIDVECLGRYSQSLAEYCMSPEELLQIEDSDNKDETFTILWTKKEALLKCTGEGITDDLKTVLTSQRTKDIEITSGCNKEKGYAWSVAVLNS